MKRSSAVISGVLGLVLSPAAVSFASASAPLQSRSMAAAMNWNHFYQHLERKSKAAHSQTTDAANHKDNLCRNRWYNVLPYDATRVKLDVGRPWVRGGDGGDAGPSDYINANRVDVADADRKYILTQGPLDTTVHDFWWMVWQERSRAIVMLCRCEEKGIEKSARYWPRSETEGFITDQGLSVDFVSETAARPAAAASARAGNSNSDFVVRHFRLAQKNGAEATQHRDVYQFHYTTWPDFGVPESPDAFLDFLFAVRDYGGLDPTVGPAVVHCSAGIGRSGTFCLVDSAVRRAQLGKLKPDNIKDEVESMLVKMRAHRYGLVQTPDQLKFCMVAIAQAAKRLDLDGGEGAAAGNGAAAAENGAGVTDGGAGRGAAAKRPYDDDDDDDDDDSASSSDTNSDDDAADDDDDDEEEVDEANASNAAKRRKSTASPSSTPPPPTTNEEL